jgi:subtilisin family serine protease
MGAGAGAGAEALVVIETASVAQGLEGMLARAGARVVSTADSSALAWVPLGRLDAVAAEPLVLAVRQPVRPVWDTTSEGLSLIEADRILASGARGQGVRIGVIDTFSGYSSKLGGELPPASRVTFRSFISGGGEGDSNHGVQVCEILTDMAPEASLFLAAIDDDVGYRNAVDWLISEGVQVINHSGGFGLFGDQKGNGPLNGKVGEAFARGLFYVESAGNNAQSHYEGEFRDRNGNGFHEFAPGVERLSFTASDRNDLAVRVDLVWDDWAPNPSDPRPTTDYDLCVYDAAGTELGCALDLQDGRAGQTPFEVVDITLPSIGTYSIGVIKDRGANRFLEVALMPNYEFEAGLNVPRSSLIVPSDHPDAFTVGATSLNDTIRGYSSLGPTNDGRLKPDLVAPDGVSTSLGGVFGTSASAPHVAGAAAILISLEPGISAPQIRDRLRSTAAQLSSDSTPGPDNTFGYGRIYANFNGSPPVGATPTPIIPPANGGGGGGGCRLGAEGPGERLGDLLCLGVVLLYAAWLGRKG